MINKKNEFTLYIHQIDYMASLEEKVTGVADQLSNILDRVLTLENTISDINPRHLKYFTENFAEMNKNFNQIKPSLDHFMGMTNALTVVNETGNEMVANSGKAHKEAMPADFFTSAKPMTVKEYFVSKMIENPIVASPKTTFRDWVYSKKDIVDNLSNEENKTQLNKIRKDAQDKGFDENAVNVKYNKEMYQITWNYLRKRPQNNAAVVAVYDKIVTKHTEYKDAILLKAQEGRGTQL